MVSGVGRGMGVLDRVEIVDGGGAVLEVNVGHSIVTIYQWRLGGVIIL